jgi:hypothetical protein
MKLVNLQASLKPSKLAYRRRVATTLALPVPTPAVIPAPVLQGIAGTPRPAGGTWMYISEKTTQLLERASQPVRGHPAVQPYGLRDAWMLINSCDTHICNNRSRFTDFTPAADFSVIQHSGTVSTVQGTGTVVLSVQGLHSPVDITLINVTYAPSFHTNLICQDRFFEGGHPSTR